MLISTHCHTRQGMHHMLEMKTFTAGNPPPPPPPMLPLQMERSHSMNADFKISDCSILFVWINQFCWTIFPTLLSGFILLLDLTASIWHSVSTVIFLFIFSRSAPSKSSASNGEKNLKWLRKTYQTTSCGKAIEDKEV